MLSKRICELRFSLGLNQVQFGQALNVTKQTISNWENDNIQPLIKIVNTYSVSADYLLGINERETVDVSGLSQEQIAHIQMIIDDIRNK
jgi:DNA-binding XRE family transcriptional regulator